MSNVSADQGTGRTAFRPFPVRGWPIWGIPQNLLTAILTVELATLGVVALGIVRAGAPTTVELQYGALLAVLGLLHGETAVQVERIRRRISVPHHIDMSSVWIFAGVLVLPIGLVAGLVLVLQIQIWVRTGRPRMPYFKHLFTATTLALASCAAHAVIHGVNGPGPMTDGADLLGVLLGLLIFTTVNGGLVGGAIAMSSAKPSMSVMFGALDDNALEVATLCFGALVAATLIEAPWMLVFVFPPLLLLHRTALVRQLQEKASTDGKTGLLNAAAWHTQAERELRRAGRRAVESRAVLVVDLDHFKDVNDRHGHLAGDEVLAAVAEALRSEVRERDLVGRFGGEEFVVLLGALGSDEESPAELAAVAERIRSRIAALRVQMPTPDGPLTVGGLSASVGAALYPEHGRDVRSLLHVADTALYAAKRAGRNVVRMGTHAPAALPPAAVQVPAQAGEPTTSH
jgi:diguanylate cyclase (GGDEF)-like protein